MTEMDVVALYEKCKKKAEANSLRLGVESSDFKIIDKRGASLVYHPNLEAIHMYLCGYQEGESVGRLSFVLNK